MSKLYKKQAKITIADREFSYPPFSIEFELKQEISSATKTICRLFNPSNNTITACESEPKKNGKKEYPECSVDAGYEDNVSTVAEGSIKSFDVFKQGRDRILQIEIFDTVRWYDQIIHKPFTDTKASAILKDIIGDRQAEINLGEDKLYPAFLVKSLYLAIVNIARDTKSNFALKNGTVILQPYGFDPENAIDITFDTGLVETPEKIDKPQKKTSSGFNGYRIQTLFLNTINLWSSVKVKTNKVDFTGVVVDAYQKFSTFQKVNSEYKVRI